MKTLDLKYTTWFDTPLLNPKIGKHADNRELHAATNAFLSNMERVELLGQLPCLLVSLGMSQGSAYVLATAQGKEIEDVFQELRAQPEWRADLFEAAKHLASKASNSTSNSYQKGYRALVASTLTTSYGALENLLVDIWNVVVELRPGLRAKLPKELKTRPIGRKNLKEFRKIYEQMFPEEEGKPRHGLSQEFVKHYGCLLVLEAVRNLFAHRCGVVDAKFLDLVKTSDALKGLRVGEELFVGFDIARALAGVTRDFGIYLIKFVDWWLSAHPASDTNK